MMFTKGEPKGLRTNLRKNRIGAIAAATVALGLALTGCSGASGSIPSAGGETSGEVPKGITAETVSIMASPTISLNPALGPIGQTATLYTYMAYGSLIFQQQDGTFVPDLAESWGYEEGSANQVFTIKVREGVKFASGADFNAEAVVNHLLFFQGAGGPQSAMIAAMTSATAADDLTVRLEFSQPTPNLDFVFSQSQGVGSVIGPDGLKDPGSLETKSDGAGPFILESDSLMAGSQYVYKANPNYFNPDAVHFNEVVIKNVTDENAILAGLNDGSLDMAFPMSLPMINQNALNAGLRAEVAPYGVMGLILADRDGEVSPLGDPKVREAINLAFDRDEFATITGGPTGIVTNQLSIPGAPGYDDALSDANAYNVERAKKLLAEAGYPDGFTLPILEPAAVDFGGVVGQAVVAALADIGIKGELTLENEFAQFIPKVFSKEYPALIVPTALLGEGYYYAATQALGTFWNPFGSSDPELTKLFEEAASADGADAQEDIFNRISARFVELNWFAPFGTSIQNQILGANIQGTELVTDAVPGVWSPFGPTAELSYWSTAGN